MSSDGVTELWQARLNACFEAGQSSAQRLNAQIADLRLERAKLQMQLGKLLKILKDHDLLEELLENAT